MSDRGLYQPRIADEHIRKLYWIAKRQGLKMTKLLNLIVAVAIEGLEHAGDVEAPTERKQRAALQSCRQTHRSIDHQRNC